MHNKLFALAIGACSFFAACDNGSTTKPEDQVAEAPVTPTFAVSSCQEVTDDVAAAQLETAKSNIDDILVQLGKGNLKNAQVISAQTKSAFKSVLDQYPSNCEAQLGYALSIITDLINNKQINAYIDTVTNKVNLANMDVEDFNKLLIAGDGKLLTTMQQEAMSAAIPSLDSAIIYMKNIVGDDKFICHYVYDGRLFELDRGEFAPALSILYIIKAALTFSASINLDISANGRYDWLNEQVNNQNITKSTANQIISLMDRGSSFTTVYSSWKSRYKEIPNLLDSAIMFVELGLQYGIEESKTGIATQTNDPYIVGDDEFSDVSARDFQKAIDSLEHYRQNLRSGVTVTLPAGSKVSINIAKFFDITDGWQDFLPYHKFNDFEQWYTPVDGFYWDADPENSYAEKEIKRTVIDQINKQFPSADIYTSFTTYQDWHDDQPTYRLCVEIETKTGYTDECYNAIISNCSISFTKRNNSYSESNIEYAPLPINLSAGVCKVEMGQSMFATPYREMIDNILYFTDASGKKTISLQGLANGKIDPFTQRSKIYSLDEIKNFLIFPDVTFGGILPGMTTDKFWDVIKTEIGYHDPDYR